MKYSGSTARYLKAPLTPTDVGAQPLATRSVPPNANSRSCTSPYKERQGESGRYMRTCPRPKTTWMM